MPLVYRAMQAAGQCLLIGHVAGDTLGIREGMDIEVIGDQVRPNTGGMSVGPAKVEMPPHLIPKRFRRHGYLAARRNNTKPETFPWRMGQGAFVGGPLAVGLQFRPDPLKPEVHGFVEPERVMSLADCQAAVEATQTQWVQEQW